MRCSWTIALAHEILMKLRMVLVFAAGFATAVIFGSISVRPEPVTCKTGDMTRAPGAGDGKDLERVLGGWIHKARECHVGEYLIVVPEKPQTAGILVGRNRKPVFMASNSTIDVLDQDRVVYEWDRERRTISFDVYDPARQAWITNVDADADGTLDLRWTSVADRVTKTEFRAGDQWLEFVKRDGRGGTVLNGRFVSIDDALARRGERAPWPRAGR